MVILPKQVGVALGLSAFSVASLSSIFAGASLEMGIFRGAVSFFVFLVIGWWTGYLIYEKEEQATQDQTDDPIEPVKPNASLDQKKNEGTETFDDSDTMGLKPPDDSDF